MTSKRLTDDQWAAIQADFNKWCIKQGKVNGVGYYKAVLSKKDKVSLSGFEKRVRENSWKQTAQEHVDKQEAPKLRKELKESKVELEAKTKAVEVIETITGAKVDPQGAAEYINETIENIKHGMGNNIESFCMMTQIVKDQLRACHKSQHPKPAKEGDKQEIKELDPFQAQAIRSLVGALKDVDIIMRKSVRGNTETMKELFSLEDHAVNQMILYKEQAKLTGKKDENSEKQEEAHEFFKEMQRDEGIPIN